MPDSIKEEIEKHVAIILTYKNHPKSTVNIVYFKALLNNLWKNENIVILKDDRERVMVVLIKQYYHNRIFEHLSIIITRMSYRKLDINPLNNINIMPTHKI